MDATDLGCYDGGEFREHSEVVGGEQRQERKRGTTMVRLFIAERSSSGSTAHDEDATAMAACHHA